MPLVTTGSEQALQIWGSYRSEPAFDLSDGGTRTDIDPTVRPPIGHRRIPEAELSHTNSSIFFGCAGCRDLCQQLCPFCERGDVKRIITDLGSSLDTGVWA